MSLNNINALNNTNTRSKLDTFYMITKLFLLFMAVGFVFYFGFKITNNLNKITQPNTTQTAKKINKKDKKNLENKSFEEFENEDIDKE